MSDKCKECEYGIVEALSKDGDVRVVCQKSKWQKVRWIPVCERLPEEEGFYLCTVGAPYRNPREMIYAPQKWSGESDKRTWRGTDGAYVFDWFVEAWMPLPELYRG